MLLAESQNIHKELIISSPKRFSYTYTFFPAVLRTARSKEIKNEKNRKKQKTKKVSLGVRSVCHHGVINTQWCWSKGGRAGRRGLQALRAKLQTQGS